MAAKPENNFIGRVHKRLAHEAPHHEKMHNIYRGGTADVWYSGDKADCWIEYKWLPTVPKTAVVDPCKLLSALQVDWFTRRKQEGRNVFVCIGCPTGGVLVDRLDPMPADRFTAAVQSVQQLADTITHLTVKAAPCSASSTSPRARKPSTGR